MSKKICLITPSHISSNPRLIKEGIALAHAGYKIHIIFTQNLSSLIEHDFKILSENKNWTYDVLDLSKSNTQNKFIRLINSLLQKLAYFTLSYYPTLIAYKLSINKNYYWQKSKAIQAGANLFVAHNLGALAVAFDASKKNNTKCGFDAEDFHRAELHQNLFQKETEIAIKIENYYFPKVDYLTAASPLIAKNYQFIFKRVITTILNVFPKTCKAAFTNENEPLKLIWFSQTVGPNRGLENIMLALKGFPQKFEFHLLGNIDENYKHQLLSILPNEKYNNIFFHNRIAPNEIFEMCTHFDIGIASEPGFSKNNNIALSNKIFTYLQSGLAILASDTDAQSDFMLLHPDIGFLYPKEDPKSLTSSIARYDSDRILLRIHQLHTYQLGQQKLNWDIEQKKIIEIVNSLNI